MQSTVSITVHVPGPLRAYCGGASTLPVAAGNVRGVLEALERDRIVANPNCCTIPLTCVLKPLHDVVPLKRVHVATYQSVSGAGKEGMDEHGSSKQEQA